MNVTKYDYYSKIPNGRDIVNNSTKSSPNTEIGYVSGEETEEDRIAHDIIKNIMQKCIERIYRILIRTHIYLTSITINIRLIFGRICPNNSVC